MNFPLVEREFCKKVPRNTSTSAEPYAGMYLIALKYRRKFQSSTIYVRNVYSISSGELLVENMNEHIDRRAFTNRRGTGASLTRLRKLEVYKGPFKVTERVPNFILNVKQSTFDKIWAKAKPDYLPGGQEAHKYEPPSTPTLRMIRAHWSALRLAETWTPKRIRKLCLLLKVNEFELGEIMQVPTETMRIFMSSKNNKGYRLPGPVTVMLHMIESRVLGIDPFAFVETAEPSTETLV